MLAFAKELAMQAGAMLRQAQSGPLDVRRKGPGDLVTEMDLAAERLIIGAIRERYPDHAILAEESGSVPAAPSASASASATYRWLVDPLDGTVNYAHRWPHWAVSLGLERDGELLLGVVYAPVCGELYWAETGRGAFLDGRPLRVSEVGAARGALLAIGSVAFDGERPLREQPAGRLGGAVMKIRQTGVCSLDLCWLAAGRIDALFQGRSTPWDVAAGMAIVHEAGGRVTRPGGGLLAVADPSFLASNGALHEELVRVLSWPRENG
jgi:myo-inositol-1(or 4)-monophosphatase